VIISDVHISHFTNHFCGVEIDSSRVLEIILRLWLILNYKIIIVWDHKLAWDIKVFGDWLRPHNMHYMEY